MTALVRRPLPPPPPPPPPPLPPPVPAPRPVVRPPLQDPVRTLQERQQSCLRNSPRATMGPGVDQKTAEKLNRYIQEDCMSAHPPEAIRIFNVPGFS